MSKEQARFWFVHAVAGRITVHFAVAALTELSARRAAKKQLNGRGLIKEISPVTYNHAWAIDIGWRLQ